MGADLGVGVGVGMSVFFEGVESVGVSFTVDAKIGDLTVKLRGIEGGNAGSLVEEQVLYPVLTFGELKNESSVDSIDTDAVGMNRMSKVDLEIVHTTFQIG